MRGLEDFNDLMAEGGEVGRGAKGRRTGRRGLQNGRYFGGLMEDRVSPEALAIRDTALPRAAVRIVSTPKGTTLAASSAITTTSFTSSMLTRISTSLATTTTPSPRISTLSGVTSKLDSHPVSIAAIEMASATSLPATAFRIPTPSSLPAPSPTSGKRINFITATMVAAGVAGSIALVLIIIFLPRCIRARAKRNQIQFKQQVLGQKIWDAECGDKCDRLIPFPRKSLQRAPLVIQHSHIALPSITSQILDASTDYRILNKSDLYSKSTISEPIPLATFSSYKHEPSPSTGGVMNPKVFVRPLRAREIGFDVDKEEGVWMTQAPLMNPQVGLRNFMFGKPQNEIKTTTLPSIPDNRTTWTSAYSQSPTEYHSLTLPPAYPYNNSHLAGSGKIPNEKSAFDLDTTAYGSTIDGGSEIDFDIIPKSNASDLIPSSQMRQDFDKMVSDGALEHWQPPFTWVEEQIRLNRLRASVEFGEGGGN